jgi:aspartyl-tRNA(Asn)/glutamyl-tRNA(Gln) amidotransferase subunit A
VVGVKPSYGRLSLKGVYPLSPTSDAPGPLAVDVDSCFLIDHLMTGRYDGSLPTLTAKPADSLTFLIPEGVATADLDDEVTKAFELAVMKLGVQGVNIIKQPMPVVDASIDMFLKRPVAVFEAYNHHKPMLENKGYLYDQYVRKRLYGGSNITEQEQITRLQEKAILTRWFNKDFEKNSIDAVIYPTCPCVPPPWPTTTNVDELGAINLRCLRNTASINNLDGCSISIPCQLPGEAPVGLMVSRPHGDDQLLYEIAATVEQAINA